MGNWGRGQKLLSTYCFIYKSTQTNIELFSMPCLCLFQVGPTYGRKMITGYLRSKGIKAAESRVANALVFANPTYAQMRANNTARLRFASYKNCIWNTENKMYCSSDDPCCAWHKRWRCPYFYYIIFSLFSLLTILSLNFTVLLRLLIHLSHFI